MGGHLTFDTDFNPPDFGATVSEDGGKASVGVGGHCGLGTLHVEATGAKTNAAAYLKRSFAGDFAYASAAFAARVDVSAVNVSVGCSLYLFFNESEIRELRLDFNGAVVEADGAATVASKAQDVTAVNLDAKRSDPTAWHTVEIAFTRASNGSLASSATYDGAAYAGPTYPGLTEMTGITVRCGMMFTDNLSGGLRPTADLDDVTISLCAR